MARKIKTRPITAARQPLVTMLDKIRGQGASTFSAVEDEFLRAMQAFDVLVADGTATQGDIQNGKGDFFNDVLATLLENCSGKQLHTRPDVPGLSFRKNKLDVAYPSDGPVLFTIETKATGVPKHPRNKKQKHPEGRGGAADLEKRIREAAFKNIDIKGEMARELGKGGGATSNLSNWIKTAPPLCYLCMSVRVRDEADLKKTIGFAHIASVWFEACGLYCYGLNQDRSAYERKEIGVTTLELDRVLADICTALRNLPSEDSVPEIGGAAGASQPHPEAP